MLSKVCLITQEVLGLSPHPIKIDAEECWVQVTNALKALPGMPSDPTSTEPTKRFVEQFMMGEIRREWV